MIKLSKEMFDRLENLKRWNLSYRIGESVISDKKYDSERQIFASAHPDHSFITKPEPVNYEDDTKQPLPVPMQSMDKVNTIEELKKWAYKRGITDFDEISLGPKWDGLSILEDNFYQAYYTRGGEENDGFRRDDHMKIANTGSAVEWERFTGGEVMISRKNWQEHWAGRTNPRTGEEYKTIRGTLAGLFRAKDADPKLKYVDFIRYYSPDLEGDFDDMIECVNTYNSIEHPDCVCTLGEITQEMMNELYTEWNEHYEIDGIIVNIMDIDARESLGRNNSSGNPEYACAYKGDFEERLETTVKDVNVEISKQGYLKPTVPLETVVLSGAEVKNPTGYNMKWIFDNNVAPGTKVVVKRSGEVIPKIVEVLSYNEDSVQGIADKFATCPVCETDTVWNDSHVEMVCPNEDCDGRKLARLVAFFEILKFEEFSFGALEKLYNAGYQELDLIIEIAKDELVSIPGLGEATYKTLSSQCDIKIHGGTPLATIMHASTCFSGLGSTKIQLILDNIDAEWIRRVIEMGPEYSFSPAQIIALSGKVKGIAEKSVEIFLNGIEKFLVWYKNNRVVYMSTIKSEKEEVVGDVCAGMVVCFSGIRDEALEHFIKSNGGEVKKSYSKKINVLIAKDTSASTTKIESANADPKCRVVTIEDFKSADFK